MISGISFHQPISLGSELPCILACDPQSANLVGTLLILANLSCCMAMLHRVSFLCGVLSVLLQFLRGAAKVLAS